MKQYVVNAFIGDGCQGNPAAVCVMETWPSDIEMQKIAKENNLSETAFVVSEGKCYHLRWFTPGCEVELCGHATLATSYVLANYYESEAKEFKYQTLSGEIIVKRQGELFQLDMPAQEIHIIEPTAVMLEAVGYMPEKVYMTCDVVVVLRDEEAVINFQPDYEKIAGIHEGEGLVITAPSNKYDFVSRCFYPKESIDEDPVTGSAHCSLVPYWSKRLGKKTLTAHQASARGGVLYCEDKEKRILVRGKATLA